MFPYPTPGGIGGSMPPGPIYAHSMARDFSDGTLRAL
jgi:hypothetical protein